MGKKPKKIKVDEALNKLIRDKYYPIHTVKGEKILTTDASKKDNKKFHYFPKNWLIKMKKLDDAKREFKTRKGSRFEQFPKVPGKIPNEAYALKHFDKIIPPFKTLIPEDLQKDYSGVKSLYLKIIKDDKNIIKYYTKNKSLTDAQCKVLYFHEAWRGIHGFTINDRPLEGKYFASYIAWISLNEKDEDEIEHKTYREITEPIKTNPDGSRAPRVIQMGLNSYMVRNSLTNPTQIIDAHVKKEKLKIFDAINLGGVLSELNISPAEAFDYVCAYLNKNRDKKRLHTQDRELTRGASALKNLIDFYKAEKERTTLQKLKDKNIKVFGYKELMESKQYADYCIQVGDLQIRNYETFKKWIRNKLDAIAVLENKQTPSKSR